MNDRDAVQIMLGRFPDQFVSNKGIVYAFDDSIGMFVYRKEEVLRIISEKAPGEYGKSLYLMQRVYKGLHIWAHDPHFKMP